MLIETFRKLDCKSAKQFSMPLSLRIIKECSEFGITNFERLHFADLLSLLYSIRIDKANEYLERKRQEKMRKRGISGFSKADQKDFEGL